MNKKDYLDLLRYYLRDLPTIVVDDIVYDYEEHFNIGMAKGKTEEEIARELGYPDDVAKEYLKGDFNKKPQGEKNLEEEFDLEEDKEEKSSKWPWILLIIVLSPIILSLVFGVFGLIIGVFAGLCGGGIGLVFGGLATLFSLFPGVNSLGSITVASPLTRIFLAIALICFGIVLFYLGIKFIQFIGRLIKKAWITIKWKWVRI